MIVPSFSCTETLILFAQHWSETCSDLYINDAKHALRHYLRPPPLKVTRHGERVVIIPASSPLSLVKSVIFCARQHI